jgi:toxin ParE1/3/4
VTHRVRFTPAARSHFLDALAYIRADNPAAALSFRDKAEQALSRLRDFPESGRVLPEFPDLPFREVIVPPYRFFYRLKDDAVWIVAVWHSAQLADEPEGDVSG